MLLACSCLYREGPQLLLVSSGGPSGPCRKGATKTLRQKLGGRVGLEGESETVSGASPHSSLLPTFYRRGII